MCCVPTDNTFTLMTHGVLQSEFVGINSVVLLLDTKIECTKTSKQQAKQKK